MRTHSVLCANALTLLLWLPAALANAANAETTPPSAMAPARTAAATAGPSQSTPGAAKQSVLVMHLAPVGVPRELAESLSGVVAGELGRLDLFEIVTLQDILALLTVEKTKDLLGCEETSCIAQIGGALGVQFVVAGSVGRVDATHVVNLQLIDSAEARVLARESREVTGAATQLLEAVRQATRQVMRGILEERAGFLIVRASEPGATILLDGRVAATTPAGQLTVPAGPQTLTVERTGFVSFTREVQIHTAEVTVVDATLVPSIEFVEQYTRGAARHRLLAWLTTGLAVGLTGGGVGLYLAGNSASNRLDRDITAYNAQPLAARDPRTYQDLSDRSDALGRRDNIAGVLVAAGTAAIITSAYLWLTADDPGRYQNLLAPPPVVDGSPAAAATAAAAASSQPGGDR